ncbi:MAG: hypothetical protein HY589_00010 [Candidatus Omnitrophica bacterium]|nr:hypothetical protein [Candidatus Omnitrophota bacterium]
MKHKLIKLIAIMIISAIMTGYVKGDRPELNFENAPVGFLRPRAAGESGRAAQSGMAPDHAKVPTAASDPETVSATIGTAGQSAPAQREDANPPQPNQVRIEGVTEADDRKAEPSSLAAADAANFEPIDKAVAQVREMIQRTRVSEPGMPVLVLLDSLEAHVGKTELSRAIDPDLSAGRYLSVYGDAYRNFGITDLLQNVVIAQGDVIDATFEEKRANPNYRSNYFSTLDLKVILDDADWFMKELQKPFTLYQDYLRRYVAILFTKMRQLHGEKDRIIVFDQVRSRYYFEDAFGSGAPEDVFVIEVCMRRGEKIDTREASVVSFVWKAVNVAEGGSPGCGGQIASGRNLRSVLEAI